MLIKNVDLETVCGITSTFPENIYPEIAFAGKSNVGKSSLINSLMNRKNLARTSSEPGKTQTVNFYRIEALSEKETDEETGKKKPLDLYFVDLPGYGYAKASKTEVEKWGKMIEKYLNRSQMLKVVFLLIDIRHEPGKNDCQMFDWIISRGYEPVIIATKFDKINRSQKDKQIKLIRTTLKAGKNVKIMPFSAMTKQGRDEIYDLIEEFSRPLNMEN